MKLFFKFLFKYDCSIKNLIRTFILFFSIAISSALFVGTLLYSNILIDTFDDYITRQFGQYNVIVESRNEITKDFVSSDPSIKSIEYLSNVRFLTAKDSKKIDIVGMQNKQFENNDNFAFIKKGNLSYDKESIDCCISINTAERFDYELGDKIEVKSEDSSLVLKVSSIANNDFLFANDNEKQYSVIVDREALKLIGEKNKIYNYQYLNVSTEDLDDWIFKFNNENHIFKAAKIYDEAEVKQNISLISTPLYFILVIVIVCSIFILINSYKLLILDRLNAFGIFLSQGITNIKLIMAQICECIILGSLAGFVGGISSNFLVNILVKSTNPLKQYGLELDTSFQFKFVYLAVVFSIVFSIVAVIFPILSIRKYALKDILTERIETKDNYTGNSLIVGVILILLSLLCYFLCDKMEFLIMISLISLFIGTVLCIPIICLLMSRLIRLIHNKNEGIGLLIKNDISASKVTISSIKVLTTTIIIILVLNSIGNEMSTLVRKGYSVINFNVFLDVKDDNLQEINDIVKNDDYLIHETGTIKSYLDGYNKKMVSLIYVDTDKYKVFENYIHFENKDNELDDLKASENGIIISKQVSKLYNINKGDIIDISNLEGYKAELEVISICDAKMWRGGNYNIITSEVAKEYFGIKYPTNYYIALDKSDEEGVEYYDDLLTKYDVDIYTKEELVKYEEQNLKQIASMMRMLSNAILICGLLAVGGNALISAVYKKKEMMRLKTLGLEDKNYLKILIFANLYKVLISFLIALPISKILIGFMANFMSYLNFEMMLEFPFKPMIVMFICVLIGYILIGLMSFSKSNKTEIRDICV